MIEDLVTVATFDFLPEAETAKALLEAEGLTVFFSDAELVTTNWLLDNAVGGIKLQVPRSQAERAAALIAEMRAHHRSAPETEESDEGTNCLSCGAPLPENQSVCPACGWSYNTDEDRAGETL